MKINAYLNEGIVLLRLKGTHFFSYGGYLF